MVGKSIRIDLIFKAFARFEMYRAFIGKHHWFTGFWIAGESSRVVTQYKAAKIPNFNTLTG